MVKPIQPTALRYLHDLALQKATTGKRIATIKAANKRASLESSIDPTGKDAKRHSVLCRLADFFFNQRFVGRWG